MASETQEAQMEEPATASISPCTSPQNGKVLLSRNDLKALGINVSNSSLLRWEQLGRFPRRIRMAGTTVAWLKSEIDDWLKARAEERKHHVYADF
jgi:prophage regulatory protein